jgi:peroxiredoxin
MFRIAFALPVVFACFFCFPLFAEGTKNSAAPDISLRTVDGALYTLRENVGKGPIVVTFWATWCAPCVAEMKELNLLKKKYAGSGVEVIAISIDDSRSVNSVRQFIRTRGYPFTVLLDTEKRAYRAFGVMNVPHVFVLDRAGTIVYNHFGYRAGDEKQVEFWIRKLTTP